MKTQKRRYRIVWEGTDLMPHLRDKRLLETISNFGTHRIFKYKA